ncbi:hypothetical protein ACFQO9_06035 [Chryseobacterium zhengzhouense]|uniref:DUF4363 domain-containing protein n=1 Tax=Chryseobacterium zhengzhouense TaxID=1636086 RepID=A0ABW2M008_9FLAO
MKKIILMIGVVTLFSVTSCEKKESTKSETPVTESSTSTESQPAQEQTSTETPKTVLGVEVPKFSNPDAQKFADEYATFMAEVTEASKSGDAAKIQAISAKSQEWAKKQADMAAKMTPEDAKLWTDFAMKLSQAQMPK